MKPVIRYDRILLAVLGVVVIGGAGALGGYEYAKAQVASKMPVVVREAVTPTALPTASPSATLTPVRRMYAPVIVTAPVVTKAVR